MTLPRLSREPMVLASGSATRRAMLENAGLWIETDKPDVDEALLKTQFAKAGMSAEEAAKSAADSAVSAAEAAKAAAAEAQKPQ